MRAPKLTYAGVRNYLQAELGLKVTKTQDGEIRVAYGNDREASASYATDLRDALDTGRHMAMERDMRDRAKARTAVAAIAAEHEIADPAIAALLEAAFMAGRKAGQIDR